MFISCILLNNAILFLCSNRFNLKPLRLITLNFMVIIEFLRKCQNLKIPIFDCAINLIIKCEEITRKKGVYF